MTFPWIFLNQFLSLTRIIQPKKKENSNTNGKQEFYARTIWSKVPFLL